MSGSPNQPSRHSSRERSGPTRSITRTKHLARWATVKTPPSKHTAVTGSSRTCRVLLAGGGALHRRAPASYTADAPTAAAAAMVTTETPTPAATAAAALPTVVETPTGVAPACGADVTVFFAAAAAPPAVSSAVVNPAVVAAPAVFAAPVVEATVLVAPAGRPAARPSSGASVHNTNANTIPGAAAYTTAATGTYSQTNSTGSTSPAAADVPARSETDDSTKRFHRWQFNATGSN